MYEPGLVTRNTSRSGTWLTVGELSSERTDRADLIASLLSASANVEVSTNIAGSKWTKLVANSMVMSPCGLVGLPSGEAGRLPEMRQISVKLGREAVRVGHALGYELQPVFGLSAEELSGGTDVAILAAMDALRTPGRYRDHPGSAQGPSR